MNFPNLEQPYYMGLTPKTQASDSGGKSRTNDESTAASSMKPSIVADEMFPEGAGPYMDIEEVIFKLINQILWTSR